MRLQASSLINFCGDYSNNRLILIALATYDYLLTIKDEKSLVWRRGWTGTTWLFLINRLLMIGNAMYDALPLFTEKVRRLLNSRQNVELTT